MINPEIKIAIIGAGTIGLSFAALHLTTDPDCRVSIFDPRPDLQTYVDAHLPAYLSSSFSSSSSSTAAPDPAACIARLTLAPSLEAAVRDAAVVQEQGPEEVGFKAALWPRVEAAAPATALLWSSTSGIPASAQAVRMRRPARLLVVHPYNPPHVMPLLELVPGPVPALVSGGPGAGGSGGAAATADSTSTSPSTATTATTATSSAVEEVEEEEEDVAQQQQRQHDELIARTQSFWRARGRVPVLVRREGVGFVANRLAFALFREACSLVAAGYVDVRALDEIVCASMGPRWSVAGPFRSYHAGGGEGGLDAFLAKIGGTVGACWRASEEDVVRGGIRIGAGGDSGGDSGGNGDGRDGGDSGWQVEICRQVREAYGDSVADTAERDRKTRKVLEAVAS